MKVRYNFQNSAPMACCLKQEWNHHRPIVDTQHHFVSTIFAPDALASITFIFPLKMEPGHGGRGAPGLKPTEHDLAQAGAGFLLSARRGYYQGVSVDHLQPLGGNSNNESPSQAVYKAGTDLFSHVMRLEYCKVGSFSPRLQTYSGSHSRSRVKLKLILWLLDSQFRALLIQIVCFLLHKWT